MFTHSWMAALPLQLLILLIFCFSFRLTFQSQDKLPTTKLISIISLQTKHVLYFLISGGAPGQGHMRPGRITQNSTGLPWLPAYRLCHIRNGRCNSTQTAHSSPHRARWLLHRAQARGA